MTEKEIRKKLHDRLEANYQRVYPAASEAGPLRI